VTAQKVASRSASTYARGGSLQPTLAPPTEDATTSCLPQASGDATGSSSSEASGNSVLAGTSFKFPSLYGRNTLPNTAASAPPSPALAVDGLSEELNACCDPFAPLGGALDVTVNDLLNDDEMGQQLLGQQLEQLWASCENGDSERTETCCDDLASLRHPADDLPFWLGDAPMVPTFNGAEWEQPHKSQAYMHESPSETTAGISCRN